jgi:L-lactate permease
MEARPEYASGCPIVARGLGAGAFWGAPLGAVILLLTLGIAPADSLAAAAVGALFGAVIGGLVGLISGLVLAVAEHPNPTAQQEAHRNDRNRRRTGLVSSCVPFLLLALTTIADPRTLLFWLPVALVSGAAGALLAPCVVAGRGVRT